MTYQLVAALGCLFAAAVPPWDNMMSLGMATAGIILLIFPRKMIGWC